MTLKKGGTLIPSIFQGLQESFEKQGEMKRESGDEKGGKREGEGLKINNINQ